MCSSSRRPAASRAGGGPGARSMARREPPPILTVPVYLRAVRSLHALGVREIARGLHVSPSVVRRWLAGTLVRGWHWMKAMTAVWRGEAVLLARGAAAHRY